MAGKDIGWDAAGLLKPLWAGMPGGRDAWARAAGSTGSSLSNINTKNENVRRNLGIDLAERLVDAAAVLGVQITIFDLGAPAEAAVRVADVKVVDRLGALEETAVRVEDLGLVMRVLRLLASGNRREALRVLSEAEAQAR